MIKILLQNPLTMLEEFHCERNTDFTLATINLLVNNCDNLKALSDLQSWTGIDPGDLSQFRQYIRQTNYDLDTRSHQKLRKYVEMRDFERQTHYNLVTGPALQRIRIADREIRNNNL